MIPLDVLGLFLAASLALGVAPGPDNIFVLTQSALFGPRAGLFVTLGLCTGLMVHTIAVAFGVAAIFQSSLLAFTILKLLGAAYLLYLAWGAFRAGAGDLSKDQDKDEDVRILPLYRRGILMNLTNPKVLVFFLAFLPQFADPERGTLSAQILVFGALFILTTFLIFFALAFGAGMIGDWLRHSKRAQIYLNRVAGTIFIALALKLATSKVS